MTRHQKRREQTAETREYERELVSVAGLTNLQSVDAERVEAAGKTAVDGPVRAGRAEFAGKTEIDGSLDVGTLSTAGKTSVAGDLTAEHATLSGKTAIDGTAEIDRLEAGGKTTLRDLTADHVDAGGSLTVGTLLAERFRFEGVVEGNSVEADDAEIRLRGGESELETLRADDLRVERGDSEGELTVGTVEGVSVRLDAVTAEEVIGESVELGPDCDVGLVRADELTGDEDAAIHRREEPDE